MKIDRLDTTELGVVCIRENTEGKYHRRTLSPGSDISTEPQEVKDVCNEAWTPEIIQAYEIHKAEQI